MGLNAKPCAVYSIPTRLICETCGGTPRPLTGNGKPLGKVTRDDFPLALAVSCHGAEETITIEKIGEFAHTQFCFKQSEDE